MIVKALYGWLNRYTAPDIVSLTKTIIAAMTAAKTTFATPVPALSVVETANAALEVAIADAADGSREMRATLRAKLAELVSLMRQLAAYVTSTANGDMAVLISSGFPPQKATRQPVGQLPQPSTPIVRQSNLSGKILVSTSPIYGASSYNWRVALASEPNTYVQTAQTAGGRATFDGLTPGELYNVEVNAVGAAGPSNWSVAGQLRVI